MQDGVGADPEAVDDDAVEPLPRADGRDVQALDRLDERVAETGGGRRGGRLGHVGLPAARGGASRAT